jgi:hypothetical protein
MHFQPLKYRRRAYSSELSPRPSKQIQATLHGTSLLQSTQITNWYPNTHIQRGKRINETMSFQPKSSGPLPHNHLHKHTSDLQQFEIYQGAIEQSNVQIKPLTQCIQFFSRPFAPQTWAEVSHLEK